MSPPLMLALWFAASIPLAVVTGRAIGRHATRTTSQPSELQARLAEVELREIPRVRRAIAGWVDDPYLAGELRELTAEAERLRGLVGSSEHCRVLAPRGTLVIVGGDGGGRWLGGFDRQIVRAPVLSALSGQTLRGLVSKEKRADLERLAGLIDSGEVTPVIDRTYPLHEAPEAIRYLARGHPAGKIAIRVGDPG